MGPSSAQVGCYAVYLSVRERRPLIRASQVRSNLAAVRHLDDAVMVSDIFDELGETIVSWLDGDAIPLWVPLEVDQQLFAAIHQRAGLAGVRNCGRKAMLEVAGMPSFRPLVQATVRIFGLTPASLFRLGPKAWCYAVRNAGELVYLGGEVGAPQLRYVGAPDTVLDDEVYMHSIAASFEAAIWYAGMRGTVEFEFTEAGVDFVAAWRDAEGHGPGDAMGA